MAYLVKCDYCGAQAVALPELDSNKQQTGRIVLPRGWWSKTEGWRKIHACSLECKSKLASMKESEQHD